MDSGRQRLRWYLKEELIRVGIIARDEEIAFCKDQPAATLSFSIPTISDSTLGSGNLALFPMLPLLSIAKGASEGEVRADEAYSNLGNVDPKQGLKNPPQGLRGSPKFGHHPPLPGISKLRPRLMSIYHPRPGRTPAMGGNSSDTRKESGRSGCLGFTGFLLALSASLVLRSSSKTELKWRLERETQLSLTGAVWKCTVSPPPPQRRASGIFTPSGSAPSDPSRGLELGAVRRRNSITRPPSPIAAIDFYEKRRGAFCGSPSPSRRPGLGAKKRRRRRRNGGDC
ncbi:hypothetical protein NL676_003450 [Syzygium grande]|nr:hypothetical protein NL676_003450 [Syzygium grande]